MRLNPPNKIRALAIAAISTLLGSQILSQTPSPAPTFTADVHSAPRRSYPFYFSVLLPENRLVVRDATMLDLIATAWDLDPDNVQGGPSWLALDRFDVIAKVPPSASKADQKLMLRALLTDRFHVALHPGSAPMPAYVLSVSKEKPRFKPAEGTGDSTCDGKDQPPSTGPTYNYVACRNITMDDFAQRLHQMAGGYLDKPVVNSTGLEGTWDLDLKWTGRGDLAKQGPDGISIFDAVDKQLGLRLTLDTAPRPVVIVDSATRQPTQRLQPRQRSFPHRRSPSSRSPPSSPASPASRVPAASTAARSTSTPSA